MTKEEQLLQKLQDGKALAIKARDLETALAMVPGNTNEPTRQLVTNCILQNKWPIGSSNKGYFLINSRAELDSVVDSLEGRKDGLQKRIDALKKGWDDREQSRSNGGNSPK